MSQVPLPISCRRQAVVALLLLSIFICSIKSSAQARSEFEVKAAFLFNFAKFVDWQPDLFPAPDTALKICVIGENPFGPEFAQSMEGKIVQGRKLQLFNVQDVQQARSCQILYIASSNRREVLEILKGVSEARILTVGDNSDFARSGGVISFVLENNRVRFDINVEAAERAGLKLSSKLLGVATIIREKTVASKN